MSDCNASTKTAVNYIARSMKIRDDREMNQRFRLEMFIKNQESQRRSQQQAKGIC